MNTPTPAPSWPTRMAAIFNEWARRYSESPDSFGDVLGPDGNTRCTEIIQRDKAAATHPTT